MLMLLAILMRVVLVNMYAINNLSQWLIHTMANKCMCDDGMYWGNVNGHV